jgi:hypothetical protein
MAKIVAGFSRLPGKPQAANFLVQVRTHFVPLNKKKHVVNLKWILVNVNGYVPIFK